MSNGCYWGWGGNVPHGTPHKPTASSSPLQTLGGWVIQPRCSVHQPGLLIEPDIKHPQLKSRWPIRNRMWCSGVDFMLWRTTWCSIVSASPGPEAVAEHGLFFLLSPRPHFSPFPNRAEPSLPVLLSVSLFGFFLPPSMDVNQKQSRSGGGVV